MMAETLPLLRGSITLTDALDRDEDVCFQLGLVQKREDFFRMLSNAAHDIEAIVATHLAVPQSNCTMLSDIKTWRAGSYNVCIPVHVQRPGQKYIQKVLIRFPQPYKIGEDWKPGNSEEKLRTEVATYIWMQKNCPTVPIPRLLGFGFPSGTSFTALESAPILNKAAWYIRSLARSVFGRPSPCRYASFRREELLGSGYLLLEYVEQGTQLCFSSQSNWKDQKHRFNLFHDLSKIIFTLARTPLPCIGSWTIDDGGVITLSNRPLTGILQQLENEGIPTGIPRGCTYIGTDSYYLDILDYHDNRLKHQPNAVQDQIDGEEQLAILTCMRALLHHFTKRDDRRGPFVMQFTDLHPSNIFVDEDWHITKLIDLEWVCSRPLEMLRVPAWLTNGSMNTDPEDVEAYGPTLKKFIGTLDAEKADMEVSKIRLAKSIQSCWDSGAYWFFTALDIPECLYSVFMNHIQKPFITAEQRSKGLLQLISSLWIPDANRYIQARVADKEDYQKRLRAMFAQENKG